MKRIECIVYPSKLKAIRDSIGQFGFKGMTLTNALGCGLQKGRTEIYRGYTITNNFFIKTKIELVVRNEFVDYVVDLIIKAAQTGEIGDGMIFVSDIESAVRIRSGDCGNVQ
ncbi:P-II family nitrogen regulator [Desulfosporosinus lacus]|uniref:Nitrogen regulatory protein P-II family n=1 Tax=Desulfosporosinus lacus DSM 15449 TaxID=1121420 RepID=A0A1M5VJ67_9FIRM|nr:P-II family nitrogen regulator [Desulfosporosinus lacus]MDA8228494.1 P-II family nitrogen regulator [Desulfitobacterium hafniense]SHH75322.1 nitrogen regulatory protein P-II family [Desulfosporosinus lacus DSM 15449]